MHYPNTSIPEIQYQGDIFPNSFCEKSHHFEFKINLDESIYVHSAKLSKVEAVS